MYAYYIATYYITYICMRNRDKIVSKYRKDPTRYESRVRSVTYTYWTFEYTPSKREVQQESICSVLD